MFLFPFALIVLRHGVPFFMDAVTQREVSINAGGLVIWPVKLLVPAGFALLLLKGVSRVVRTIARLRGALPVDAPFATHADAEQRPGPGMTEWLISAMGPLMFAGLVLFLLLGYPVAFALAAIGLAFGAISIGLDLMNIALLQALPARIYGIMQNETLLAIPFFTFMGLILERSGMAEDLLETIGQRFGNRSAAGSRMP